MIYWHSTLVPAACLIKDELETNTECDVVDAVQLGWKLANAAHEQDAQREMVKLIAEEAGEKAVFFAFPPEMKIQSKVGLVRAIYAAQARQFQAMADQIQNQMIENPKYAAWLRQEAIFHSATVAEVRKEASNEARSAIEDTANQVSDHPNSRGFAGECHLSCRQLHAAAHGINVFDNN